MANFSSPFTDFISDITEVFGVPEWSGKGNSGEASLMDGLFNTVTGNQDWKRTQAQNAFNANEALKQRNFEAEQAGIARDFNASEAQKQRDFEQLMSNTAYQRAVNDLQASGLNPYLAYNQGGASTPSGATASTSAPSGTSARSGNYVGNSSVLGNLIGTAIRAYTGLEVANTTRKSESRNYNENYSEVRHLK